MQQTALERLEKHKTGTVSRCCSYSSIVLLKGKDNYTLRVVKNTCKSYLCPRCRPRLYKDFRKRIAHNLNFAQYSMWTLSAKKELYATPSGIRTLSNMFDTFWKRVKRKYSNIKFVKRLELGELSDNPHFHLIVSGYMNHSFIQDAWKDITGGCQVRFDVIDTHNVIKYITKYITKAAVGIDDEEMLFLAGIRRISATPYVLKKLVKDSKCLVAIYLGNCHFDENAISRLEDIVTRYGIDDSNYTRAGPDVYTFPLDIDIEFLIYCMFAVNGNRF